MIKNIIFDFDGVILDSTKIKSDAFLELYKDYSEDIQKKIYKYHNENLGIDRYKKIHFFHNNFLNSKINKTELNKLTMNFSSIVFNKIINCQFVEGAREFLEKNKENYNFFISSGTPQNELKKIIKLKKIDKFFKNIYGSPLSKDKHIKIIKNKYDIKESESIFIGDANIDQITAKNNNLYFIGINSINNLFDDEKYTMSDLKNLDKIIDLINSENK
tara:strand:+ start:364 stop:1014 length:651 start_codon:yes stop_codon:yes gene_type:complete